MGMRIDEARGNRQAVDVKRSLRAAVQSADRNNLAVLDGNVAVKLGIPEPS